MVPLAEHPRSERPGPAPALSLVFPIYDEEANARRVVKDLVGILDHLGTDYELVLVNNGSRDRSGAILEELRRENPRVRAVTIHPNRGYGGGILAGLREARGSFVGYMCGDGQVLAEDVARVWRTAQSGSCDLAKVTRRARHDGWVRWLVSRVYNALAFLRFRCLTFDLNGTPKIFARKWLAVLDIRATDWFIDAEIMIKAKALGMRVQEVPVTFLPRQGGSSSVRPGTALEFLKNLWAFPRSEEFRAWKRTRS